MPTDSRALKLGALHLSEAAQEYFRTHSIPTTIAGVLRHVHKITSNTKRLGHIHFGEDSCICLKSTLMNWAHDHGCSVDLDLAVETDPHVLVGGFAPFEWVLLCDDEPRPSSPPAAKQPLLLPPPLPMPPLSPPAPSLPPSPPTSRTSRSPPSSPSTWSPLSRGILPSPPTSRGSLVSVTLSPPATPITRSRSPSPTGSTDKALKCLDDLSLLDPSSTSVGLVAASDDLCCPITLEPFDDPVVAEDGFTYEKTAIAVWISKNGTSPSTGSPMGGSTVPNKLLRRIIGGC